MAEKKKVIAKRKVDRKAFVASRGSEKDKESRKRFYVKTRLAEQAAKGLKSSPEFAKQLRQKFDSGNVSRKGFAAPKKKTRVSSSTGRTDSTGRSGQGATAQRDTSRNRIEGRGAYAPKTMPTRNQIEGRGAYAPPKTMPSRNQIEGRYGSSASVRKSGANAAAASRASTPKGRTDSAGRSGFGSTKPKASTSRRPEDMARGNYRMIKPKGDPNKKYQAVKPIGRPGKKYLSALAKKNLR